MSAPVQKSQDLHRQAPEGRCDPAVNQKCTARLRERETSPRRSGVEPVPASERAMLQWPESGRVPAVWPVFACKCRCAVNQKAIENFEVTNICLAKLGRSFMRDHSKGPV